MTIQVHCSCGHDGSVSARFAGFKIACPACGKSLSIETEGSTSTNDGSKSADSRPSSATDRPTSAKPDASPRHVRTTCTCGKTLTVNARLAGRKANCPACGKQVTFPGGATTQRRLIVFGCKCGRKLRAPVQWSGKKTKCPTCQSSVTIPASNSAAQSHQNELSVTDSPEDKQKPDLSGLLDEIGAHECKKARRCPNCKKDMDRDDVLCIECGYNVQTGKLIESDDAHRKSMLEVMRSWLGDS